MQTSKNYQGLSSQVLTTSFKQSEIDTSIGNMTVEFNNNAKWEYIHVPVLVWEESLKAPSIGKFLNTVIKPNYQAVKLN